MMFPGKKENVEDHSQSSTSIVITDTSSPCNILTSHIHAKFQNTSFLRFCFSRCRNRGMEIMINSAVRESWKSSDLFKRAGLP